MKTVIFGGVNFKDKENNEYLTFPALKGDKGDKGKSAYEAAKELGFTGTEAEWIESLKYVSSPEFDTLMASLVEKEGNATTAAQSATQSANEAKEYAESMAGFKGFEVIILEEGEYSDSGVPSIAEPKESVIYLVPSNGGTNNNYNEYIYVNSAWELVGAKQVDLSSYALKSELNDYATTESLNDYALSSALNDLATKAELEDYAKSEDLDDLATKAELNDYVKSEVLTNYATTASLNDYATKSDLDDYTTTTDLTTNFAAKSDLDNYTTTTDLSTNYALKSELVTADEKAAWNAKYDLPETGITEEELSTEVRVKLNSFFEADPVDKDLLSAYALKTELLDYVPKTSMKDYAKVSDLDDYVKSSTLADYATKEDLNDYATTESLSDVVRSSALTTLATKDDLNDLAKSADLDNYVENSELENLATKTDLEGYVETTTLDEYALKSELVSDDDKSSWSAKYNKPEGGIPETDLAQAIQDKINNPQIELDTTLKVEGAAAESKATGDAIDLKLDATEAVKFIQWDNIEEGTTISTTNNMVVLTEQEYENLSVKLKNTFYFIYDDVGEVASYDIS